MLDQIQLEKLVDQWNAESMDKGQLQQKKLYLKKCSTESDEGMCTTVKYCAINIPKNVVTI